MHVDRLARRIVEHRHVEPGCGAGVRHPHAGAAGRRADADALAGRQTVAAGEEADGEVEHLVEFARLDQPIALEHGAVGGLRPGERGGVRSDRARARFRLADLADDDRFAQAQRLLGGALEFLRRLHVFQEQQKHVGAAFVEHVVDEVEHLERGLVAGGDDMTEGRDFGAGAVEERKAEPAALRDHRHLASCRARAWA